MYKEDKATELKRQIEQLDRQGWQTFRDKRDTQANVIRRKAPTKLDSNLEQYEDGIDPQSGMLLKDRETHMNILTREPSKVDVLALEEGKDAESSANKKRLWYASVLNEFNDNDGIDGPWSQGIADVGHQAFRLLYKMMPEMPEGDRDKRLKKMREDENAARKKEDINAADESDDEYEEKKSEREGSARDAYMREYKEQCFWIQAIGVGEYGRMPVGADDPDVFIQKSEIPYMDPSEIRSKLDGNKKLSIDGAKKIVWLGDNQAPAGTMSQPEDTSDKTITYIVRDSRNTETGGRKITEFVCVGSDYANAEMVDEYDSPADRCTYWLVPSGGEVPNEKTPDLRWPSIMLPEVVLINQLNYLQKHVTVLARRNSMRPPFLDASKITPEAAQLIRDMPGWTEGSLGAQKGFVFQMPDPNSNEFPVIPAVVTKWPDEVDDHLAMLIQWTRDELASVRPNPVLIGTYTNSQEPATSKLTDKQSAREPYGKHLDKKGYFLKSLLETIGKIIIKWDEDSPSHLQKKYYRIGNGSEPVLTGTVEVGKAVYVTADDFRRPHHITISTKDETLQEQLVNAQESRVKFDRGEITWLKHLRNLGYDDEERTARELELDRIERERRPRADQIRQLAVESYVSDKTGLNVVMLSGGPPMPQEPTQQVGASSASAGQTPKPGVMNGVAPLVPGASGDSVGAM